MNAHVAQSYEASTELEEIAAVPHQIITPRDAKPIIGVVQDTLVGSYRITQPGNEFNLREYMNLMMWNKRFDGQIPQARAGDINAPRWTGHQVVSVLLPPLNLSMPNSSYEDQGGENSENYIKIVEGDIKQGTIDKSIFSKPSKGIIHTTYNDYGATDTVNMIDSFQHTIEQYLILNGFSVGISDLIADSKTKEDMDVVIKDRKDDISKLLHQIHLDLFDNNTGKKNYEEFESRVFASLNKATEQAGKIGQSSLSNDNRMMAMVRAGSKGGTINIAQMMACVGQQNIEGKRIPYGYTDRTLPHYKKYDDGAEARGFVESSFIRGLTPQEFFFHAMSGREGLIDTAVKTADTGYIQRKLVKGMEDLVVQHDGTVRDANMNVVQFHYGEDGVNATKIESQTLALGKLSETDIKDIYSMGGVDFSLVFMEGVERENDEMEIDRFIKQVLNDRKMIVEGVFGSGRQGGVYSPVNIERLMTNLTVKFGLTSTTKTDLTPLTVLAGIQKVIQRTQEYHRIWAALLRYYLAPHRIIVENRFTRNAFEALCEVLVVKNWQSWVQPGELVGILAAQSIGEPSTQMSAIKTTVINIKKCSGENFYGTIGEFIDNLMEENKSRVVSLGGDSTVLDLETSEYQIVGVSEDEKVSWKGISQVSRHPANGGLVKVTTQSGRTTTATLSHSFLRRDRTGIVPVLGSDLKEGMRIPIARSIPEVPNALKSITYGTETYTLDKEFGWMCGIYLADGCLNGNTVHISKVATIVETKLKAIGDKYGWKFSTREYKGEYGPSKDNILHSANLKNFINDTFKTGSYEKRVGGLVFNSNKEFIAGVIGGYFDGDGNVNPTRQMIRASSRNKELIEDVARLFGFMGIFLTFGEETSVNIPDKTQYTMTLTKKYAQIYKDLIGFSMEEKAKALDEIIEYENRDEKHDVKQNIDMIPELGDVVADVGKALNLPGQSRNYGRWRKKEAIGRETLDKYYTIFMAEFMNQGSDDEEVRNNLAIIKSALDADVVWDKIMKLDYLDDPKEYVYDFTVPGNDSFMVDCNVLVHNTLNTFHLAGVASKSNVTRGVPRLKELLTVTHNPKATSLTVYLKPEFRELKEKAREVAQDLELTLLRDITMKAAIYYDPKDDTTILKEDKDVIDFYKLFEQTASAGEEEKNDWSKWMMRIELDREKMFNKNITTNDIAFVLRDSFSGIDLVYSDYNSKKLMMRIRVPKGNELDDLQGFKKFQNKILNGIVIRGITGIKSATFREDNEKVVNVDGEYKSVKQYIIDTDGSNYLEVMNHPAVDGNRLYSTNLLDAYEQLGIEAARNVLLSEITTLFEEVGVNYRHLGLLCDVMTRPGRMMSIDRYGINKSDIGPIAKASFEETERILLKASQFGEVDPITGVSANIMVGQPIRGGTNFSTILLDEDALVKMSAGVTQNCTIEEEGNDIVEDDEIVDDMTDPCATSRFNVNIAMPKVQNTIVEDDMELVIV